METTAGGDGKQAFTLQQQTTFSAHPKSSLARIDKRTARVAGNTRYRYNKIGPLDHKMADNCVRACVRVCVCVCVTGLYIYKLPLSVVNSFGFERRPMVWSLKREGLLH